MYRFGKHIGRLGITSHTFSGLARHRVVNKSSFVYNTARCMSSINTGNFNSQESSWGNTERSNRWGLMLGGSALAFGLGLYMKEKSVQAKSSELPSETPYLIIGGGAAAVAACRAIRTREPDAKVLIVSAENHMPYKRHPMSKEMFLTTHSYFANDGKYLSWEGKEQSIFYEEDAAYSPSTNVDLAINQKVVRLDVDAKKAVLDTGAKVKFDKCLIATGSKPRSIPWIDAAGEEVAAKVTYFRTIDDFRAVSEAIKGTKAVAVVGSGFLGSELSYAMMQKGKDSQTRVFHLQDSVGNATLQLPEYLRKWTLNKMVYQGGEIRNVRFQVRGCSYDQKTKKVNLEINGYNRPVEVDHIIVAEDCEAVVDIGEVSGLEVDPDHGGFVVNAELEARNNVWVAGDASCYYDILLGRRRVEHQQHAEKSGTLAGENMTGAHKPYLHQPMFWSELGSDIKYQTVGICDSNLNTFGIFFREGDELPAALDDESTKVLTITTQDNKITSCGGINMEEDSPGARSLKGGGAFAKFNRGFVFYVREGKPVGTLVWNMSDAAKTVPKVEELLQNPELLEAINLPEIEEAKEELEKVLTLLKGLEPPVK